MPTEPIYKSRRFWTAVVGVAMMVAVNLVPALAQSADVLTTAILVVIGLLIGGYTADSVVATAAVAAAFAEKARN